MSETHSKKDVQESEAKIGEDQSPLGEIEESKGVMTMARIYCQSEYCTGDLVEAKVLDQLECPVCYCSFGSEKLAIARNCNHMFCQDCITDWGLGRGGCPMCRQDIECLIFSFSPLLTLSDLNIGNHTTCFLNNSVVKEYLKNLNKQWLELVGFIQKTQMHTSKIIGVKGTEHLKLEKYEAEGRLKCKDKVFAVLKTETGFTQVVFCCFLLNTSIRLVISNETIDIETDNKAADEIVECINIQLNACWRIFPQLLNKNYVNKIFVRKFENVTCVLAIYGVIDYDNFGPSKHQTPMKTQLMNMSQCNFDYSHYATLRKNLPSLSLKDLKISTEFLSSKCCTGL